MPRTMQPPRFLAVSLLGLLMASALTTACGKPRINEIGMENRKLSYVSGTAREGSTRVEVQWRQRRFTTGLQSSLTTAWSTLGHATVHGKSWSLGASRSIDLIDGIPDPDICCLITEFRARSYDAQGNVTELAEVGEETVHGQEIGTFGPVVLGHYAGTASVNSIFSPMAGILDLERIHMLVADGPDHTGAEIDVQSAAIDVSAVQSAFPWLSNPSVYGTLHLLPVSSPSGHQSVATYPGAPAVQVRAPFNVFTNFEYPFVLGMVTLWAPGYASVASAIDARTDLADIQIDVTETAFSGTRSRRGVHFSGRLSSTGTQLH